MLAQILMESAALLAEAQHAGDPRFLESATDLAIRSLRAAGLVLGQRDPAPVGGRTGRVVSGPWPAPGGPGSQSISS